MIILVDCCINVWDWWVRTKAVASTQVVTPTTEKLSMIVESIQVFCLVVLAMYLSLLNPKWTRTSFSHHNNCCIKHEYCSSFSQGWLLRQLNDLETSTLMIIPYANCKQGQCDLIFIPSSSWRNGSDQQLNPTLIVAGWLMCVFPVDDDVWGQ